MFITDTVRQLAGTERIAAVKDGAELSFRELEAHSNALAVFLLKTYPNHDPIILWGDKENDMLCAMLAALKTGHPYVVIPDNYPELRVRLILESCLPTAILKISAADFPAVDYPLHDIAALSSIYHQYAGQSVDPGLEVQPKDLVCIFYTSGSTGTPKGVCVSRENIEAFAEWWHGYCDGGIENPRMMNIASYAFADSVMTVYTLLGSMGATLYSADHALQQDYRALLRFILEVDPHYMDCTPSFANLCLKDSNFSSAGLPSMFMLSLGGEALTSAIAEQLLDRFPNAHVVNAYGATETTIGTLACEVTRDMIHSKKPIPVGTTSYNSRVYISDEQGNPLPDGQQGELIVVSDMIAMGYYHDAERTAQSFFTDETGTRAFHTHDLAWMENGMVYYVGRSDHVVKVGGYRVDLMEVEEYLSRLEQVEFCAVVPIQDHERVIMIAAYVVPAAGFSKGVKTTIAIKSELKQYLQDYMIPQKFLYLEALPFTPTGKIDRKLLSDQARIH